MGLHLAELLFIVNLIFQSALHNVFSDFFDTANKKILELVVMRCLISLYADYFTFLISFSLIQRSEVVYIFLPAVLQQRHILNNFVSNLLFCHSRPQNCRDKFFKFSVLDRQVWIVISGPSGASFWDD